jgi:hypothetical protein
VHDEQQEQQESQASPPRQIVVGATMAARNGSIPRSIPQAERRMGPSVDHQVKSKIGDMQGWPTDWH